MRLQILTLISQSPPMLLVLSTCSGGLELLFGNQKEVETDVPTSPDGQLTVAQAMAWARDNLLTERAELFMKGDTV
jgi:hypothetical protein